MHYTLPMPRHRNCRRITKASCLILILMAASAPIPTSAENPAPDGTGALGGGGPLGLPPTPVFRSAVGGGDCIPDQERKIASSRADAFEQQWERDHGVTIAEALGKPSSRTAAPQPYAFTPMAGTLFRAVFFNNYTDLGIGPAILDWDCTDWTYNTHQGHDMDLRSFGEQVVGVPIFAALDGVVVDRMDGHPDMNTAFAPAPANYVILSHGNSHRTLY